MNITTILIPGMLVVSLQSYAGTGCNPPGSRPNLTARPGFAEFLPNDIVQKVRESLPQVEDKIVQDALSSSDTMWYDEESMEFLYQDSQETVVGLRANCVGRRVGETNTIPGIRKLVNYFGPDYRFRFPFRTAAGTDDITNVQTFQFWVPPVKDGKRLPVKYWHSGARTHWKWTFPHGTLFGEVLFQKDNQGDLYPFEIRTRTRYSGGWAVQAFRPFQTAIQYANYLKETVPTWENQDKLSKYISSLESQSTLVAASMESVPFAKVFEPINGSLDPLPDHGNDDLIRDILKNVPFKNVEGSVWKRNSQFETYAPSSATDFNLVPKGYKIGLIPVNEVSCTRCHNATSKPLKLFDFDIQLYGEVWGEDQLFTWHPFQPSDYLYGTYDIAEYPHKKINPRLISAGLIVNSQPALGDPLYTPFK